MGKVGKVGLITGILVFPVSFFVTKNVFLSILLLVIIWWVTEPVPIFIPSILGPSLCVLFGVAGAKEAFIPFAKPVIMLFLGSFIIADAISKQGLDRRIALYILSIKPLTKSPTLLMFSVSFVVWLLSMWISNTATVAMMVPISLGIIRSVSEGDVKEFPLALMLATAYAASIGGISTPVGSPPNLIALSFLREEGVEIPFLVWMTSFLPLSFIILVFLSVILSAILKTRINLEGVHERISQEREKLPPMTLKDWGTIGIFALTVFLWMSPSIFKAIGIGLRPDEGAVALFCASLLFVARIEDKDALKRINWGAILLFGGGLSMGSLIIKTGLSEQIGNFLFELLPRSGFLKVFIIALFVSFATEVTSNTATASVFVPILAGATQLMLTAAIAASFAFMLPVATPPNAIVYGTGHIKIKDMVKVGIVIDVLAALFLAVYMWMR